MAESYSLTYTATSVTFRLTGTTAGQRYRLFVRLASNEYSQVINDYPTASGSTLTKTYGGLSPKTNYVANFPMSCDGRMGCLSLKPPSRGAP